MPTRTTTSSATYHAFLTTNSVTIDLTAHAEGPSESTGAASRPLGRASRAVIPQGAAGGTCTLAVTRLDGDQITIANCAYGVEQPVQAKKILPASNYTGLLVLW